MNLNTPKYTLFSPNDIRPTGWMRRQLEIQAAGQAGNLDKIWPSVRDSAWIGGSSDSWERVPYWLDGFIPLAFLLDDEDMKARAKRYIDGILARQEPDGWICPCEKKARVNYDVWAVLLISKVLVLWHECTGDERIPDALYRALKNLNRTLDGVAMRKWGATRWFEGLFAIYFVYDRCHEDWLIELADKLYILGVDWKQVFARWHFSKPSPHWSSFSHVVNLGMMLKQEALYSRITGADPSVWAREALGKLTDAHGTVYGLFSGDECTSGRSPIQGTELCSVVEAMFSFETLMEISGDAEWGDRLEYLAFNALPATMSTDMWTHQYDQMANQIACTYIPREAVHFSTNNGESHLFGLEPHFGCCTANHGQGWPKLARAAFMRRDGGIASTVLVPGELTTEVNGVAVKVSVDTAYPFRGTVTYTVETAAEIAFDLDIRIPGFAKSAYIDSEAVPVGSFHTISRTWSGKTTLTLTLEFAAEWLDAHYGDMQALRRGPLLYALPIAERRVMREFISGGVERRFPYCDYELHPTSDWNYAFAGEPGEAVELDYGDVFAADAPPVAIDVPMCKIDWPSEHGVCADVPAGREPLGEAETIRMIPYGCTNLRMTVMPKIK